MANNQQLLLGEGAGSAPAVYIEDVFSTYLYTGNGSTQTITNNIDLSTKGGLVWIKQRNISQVHVLVDTVRGNNKRLQSNSTAAEDTTSSLMSFNADGFSVPNNYGITNSSGQTYASWTFREQAKFFDVVTYTGTGSTPQTISHSLGSTPGCVIVKTTGITGNWYVWHRSLASDKYLLLESTAAQGTATVLTCDSTSITLQDSYFTESGRTFVVYIFAHDAGGFGLAGTDNVISCGSFTRTFGTANSVNLGYEPQWVLIKCTSQTDSWQLYDTMRGLSQTASLKLEPNSSNPESDTVGMIPTATGFDITATGVGGGTFIYIAIRRGPMKVPTVGTSVFSPQALNAPANGTQVTTGFPIDLSMFKPRDGGPSGQFQDRLRGLPSTAGGGTPALYPDATVAESTNQTGYEFWNTGYRTYTSQNAVWWMFRRAPGFFDEVCYTGTGSNTTFTHNLGTVPEVIIIKSRSGARNWNYLTTFGASTYTAAILNDTYAPGASPSAYDTLMQAQPTATQFSVSTAAASNNSGETYVAYLFATVAGVSKIGTYTGNGSSQTIACGFAAGSRFVLIKRISASGDWYVWDSARGIIAGNDPHLSLNTTAAEVTTDDSVDTDNSGFIVNQLAATNVNVTSATYIFLAIS